MHITSHHTWTHRPAPDGPDDGGALAACDARGGRGSGERCLVGGVAESVGRSVGRGTHRKAGSISSAVACTHYSPPAAAKIDRSNGLTPGHDEGACERAAAGQRGQEEDEGRLHLWIGGVGCAGVRSARGSIDWNSGRHKRSTMMTMSDALRLLRMADSRARVVLRLCARVRRRLGPPFPAFG